LQIDEYIMSLWAPDRFRVRDYADMSLEEVRDLVRSKRAGRRGRPRYSLDEVSEYIWHESVKPSPEPERGKDGAPAPSAVRQLLATYSEQKLRALSGLMEDGSEIEPYVTEQDLRDLRMAMREDNYQKLREDEGRAYYRNSQSKGRRWQDHKRH